MTFDIPGFSALTAAINRLCDLYEERHPKPAPSLEEPASISYTDNEHEWLMEHSPGYRKMQEKGAQFIEDEMLPEPKPEEETPDLSHE